MDIGRRVSFWGGLFSGAMLGWYYFNSRLPVVRLNFPSSPLKINECPQTNGQYGQSWNRKCHLPTSIFHEIFLAFRVSKYPRILHFSLWFLLFFMETSGFPLRLIFPPTQKPGKGKLLPGTIKQPFFNGCLVKQPNIIPGKPSALFLSQKLLVLVVKLPKKIGHLAFQVYVKDVESSNWNTH